jgi:Leucine-rich repeat (LRR) protein
MRNNFFIALVGFLLLTGITRAAEVVRCGGKLYSLEFMVNKGQSPVGGASIFREGEMGTGNAVLTTYLLSSIQRTLPYYKKVTASYIQNIMNETGTNEEYLWKKTQLGFPVREVKASGSDLDASCFTNGHATIFEIVRFSKLGSINLFEYDEKLFKEIAKSDVQKNFVLVANFFSLFIPDLKDRANLTSLMLSREILMIPNEILSQIIRTFGLTTPELDGICSRSPLMAAFLQRHFALNCDLIEENDLATIKTVKLVGDNGANSFLYAQDFTGLTQLKNLHIENTEMAPATLTGMSFSQITGLEKMQLMRNNLAAVPCQILGYSLKLELLDLSYNDITDYSRGSFCGAGAKILNLSHNGSFKTPRDTTYFYPGAFQGENRLTELRLIDMNIGEIPNGVFDELTSLKVLDLGMNGLRSVQFLVDSKVSQTLTSLDLSQNPIKTFAVDFWSSFKKVETLKLEKMSLHALPELRSLKTLKELHFCNKFLKDKTASWLGELKKLNPKLVIKECKF